MPQDEQAIPIETSLHSAAPTRVRRCRVERRCDLVIGAGGGDREVACTFLRIDVQVGEASVQPVPPVQRHVLVADGCEQRMRETDSLAIELENPLLHGALDVVDGSRGQRLQQRHCRNRERGDGDERLAHTRRQRAHPVRHDTSQAVRQRDVHAVGADRAVDERASDLQREERVPARSLVHAHEDRPRQIEPEPIPEKPVDRPNR